MNTIIHVSAQKKVYKISLEKSLTFILNISIMNIIHN
jgi:hypothetical protein